MSNTGYLDINGTDLINSYISNLNPTTFTGSNVFNYGSTNTGRIYFNLISIFSASAITYLSTTVPNCIIVAGLDINITLNLPTTGVSNGFMLQLRRNNGTNAKVFTFPLGIYNLSNAFVTTVNISNTQYSVGLIHYNTKWYVHWVK